MSLLNLGDDQLNRQDSPSCMDEDCEIKEDAPGDMRLLEEYRYVREKQEAQKAHKPDVKAAWRYFKRHYINRRKPVRAIQRKSIIRYAAAASIIAVAVPSAWYIASNRQHKDYEVKNVAAKEYPKYDVKESKRNTEVRNVKLSTNETSKVPIDTAPKKIIKAVPWTEMTLAPKRNTMTAFAFTQIQDIASRTITAPPDRDYDFLLSDGTFVYLKAGSTLKFPCNLACNDRVVELWGEASFAIAGEPQRSFVVKTSKITATVWDTDLRVRAYDNQHTEITLAKGSMIVNDNNTDDDGRTIMSGQNTSIAFDDNTVMVNFESNFYTKR